MPVKGERFLVAVLALAATYLFFYEYLPPVRRVHIPYDIQGYHYPLLQYAFQTLRAGRLPEWDPSIYCGMSFAGNVQAALFYPPNWLLFAANLGREHLRYKSLEILVFLHNWLAFLLCYIWLREKRLAPLAAVLGSSVFAYTGYMLSQSSHLGVVTGYAWTPLGLWGVDQAAASRDWRRLWKVAAASALCFLAGYPPSWLVFCVVLVAYALASAWHWRAAVGTLLALAASLLLAMVQLLPLREAAALKTFDPKYGSGVHQLLFFVSYFIPNYFDFARNADGWGNPPGQYLYLGVPAFFALLWALWRRKGRDYGPAVAVGAVCLVGVTNPFGLVEKSLWHPPVLIEMCHPLNFLEGLSVAAALVTAISIGDFLRRGSPPAPPWLSPVAIGLLAAWSARQLWVGRPGGAGFAFGWRGAVEPAVLLALFSFGLYAWRAERGARRAWLAAALILAAGVDDKVFGTSRRFNADAGDVDQLFQGSRSIAMDDRLYRELRAHAIYRVAVDEPGLFPTDLRHFGLTSPQGFDPFLTVAYKKFIEVTTPFQTDRHFYLNPGNEGLLRLLGVRYFITTEQAPSYRVLSANPDFRELEPTRSYFHVFEFQKAQLPYYWDPESEPRDASVERALWTPENREFLVRSDRGGRFVLVEQFFPGWRATVDGRPTAIERWNEAFQAVEVGPGEHRIRFEFRSRGLRVGALVTILSLGALWLVARKT